MTRALRLVAALLLIATPALLAAAPPASANDGGTWNYKVGTPEQAQEYGPMAVNDASGNWTGDPETCIQLPWCTTVVLHADFPPGWDAEVNEYVLKTVLSWDDHPVANVQEGPAGGNQQSANDIDMYAYKKVTVTDSDGKPATEYQRVNQGATASQPEVMKLFGSQPDNPDVYLVIYNSIGVNTGFTIDVKYKNTSVEALPEYGGGSKPSSSSGSSDFGSSTATPVKAGGYVPPNASGLPSSAPSLVPFIPGSSSATTGSDDFGLSLPPDKSFLNELGTPKSSIDILAKSRGGVGPPKSVPAVLLFFWLGVVPIALVSGGIGWLARRRPAALTLPITHTQPA